jgi:hypothetical protein
VRTRPPAFFLVVAILVAIIPGGIYARDWFMHWAAPGLADTRDFALDIDRYMTVHDARFWWMAMIIAILVFAWSIIASDDVSVRSPRDVYGSVRYGWMEDSRTEATVTGIIAVAVFVVAAVISCAIAIDNKDVYRYNNADVEWVVSDLDNMPGSLEKLVDGADRDDNGTPDDPTDDVLTGSHDVPSRIVAEEDFLSAGWEPRVSSLAAAEYVMSQTSGESSRARLMSDSLAHLYLDDEDGNAQGYWTGIRDQSGREAVVESIIQWDGNGAPTVCMFRGDYKVNRAFSGERLRDLPNLIAEENPDVTYNESDIYGYCEPVVDDDDEPVLNDDGDPVLQPVVIIPAIRYNRHGSTSVEAPAGVIEMRGSPSGDPQFRHIPVVDNRDDNEDNDVPGPVYPLSIATAQRENHTWAAGRKWQERVDFGFEPTSDASQDGNTTEYLVRSADPSDEGMYWLTPMTPRSSDGELIQVFSVVPADHVSSGELNQTRIYVRNGSAPPINLATMESIITSAVGRQDPGFAANNGKIQEFIPAAGNTWQAFGVNEDDIPIFVATIDPVAGTAPEIEYFPQYGGTTVEESPETPSGEPSDPGSGESPSGNNPCNVQNLGDLSNEDLAACNGAVSDEFGRRFPVTTTTTAPAA